MKKKFILNIIFISLLGKGQEIATENYIHSRTYLEGVQSTNPSAKQIEEINYYDGLGRPKQNIIVKGSPTGKDIVTPIEYDAFGRQAKDYLPIPQNSTQGGGIYTAPLLNATNIYGNEKIYAEKILEISPLDRLLGQIQVGNDWQNKPVRFEYDVNTTSDRVKKYTTATIWQNGASNSTVTVSGIYEEAQLYKNSTTDEDGNTSIEFKNGQGQIISLRKLNGQDQIDTYYVYNEYNQLAFIVPPLAANNVSLNTSDLDLLCYQYRYDGRGRVVEKKLPGKDWEYLVYDQQNRLVMAQDGNLRIKNQWLFTKYDVFGRVAYTGIATGGSRSNEQNQLNTETKKYNNVERKNTIGFTKNNLGIYYANASTGETYPNAIQSLLSVIYYDTYPQYGDTPPLPQDILGQTTLKSSSNNGISTKSLALASFVKNIEDDSWTKTYTFYDEKGRVIGTYIQNHLGGYTKTESKLDFTGVVQESYVYHKKTAKDTETKLKDRLVYDRQNRLLAHYHQVNDNSEELLAKNIYDELGRIAIKHIGGTEGLPNQFVDYSYNIRGWLTKMNDTRQLGGNLFAYELRYQNPIANGKEEAKYNGNISQMEWVSTQDFVKRRYTYQYDGVNRLSKAFFSQPQSTSPNIGAYDEYLNYDKNGNITLLQRFGGNPNYAVKIDDLKYSYQGNKLTKVQDASKNALGYPLGGNNMSYDLNGNMTDLLDKGISNITYNYLNLPNEITMNQGSLKYTYRSDGVKIKKVYNNTTTDYLEGFQYVNGVLEFAPTSEGYYDFRNRRYVYNYTDHLGNIRLSYAKNKAGNLEVIEENNYYPFGMKHIGYNRLSGNPPYKYKYNGKEYQEEIGMYDYGARFYIPELGRWSTVDPLAEERDWLSSYNYVQNNPIKRIDPSGMLDDDYLLNKTGEIELIKKTNDNFDRIITFNSQEKIDNQIEVSKGILNNISAGIHEGENKKFNYFKVNNDIEAKNIFEFVAENTDVEWSLVKFGTNSNYISTSNSNTFEAGGSFLMWQLLNTKYNVKEYIHSHPNRNTEFHGPSGFHPQDANSGDRRIGEWLNKNYPKRGIKLKVYEVPLKQYIEYNHIGIVNNK